jgi:CheY-like chemotaxis protein
MATAKPFGVLTRETVPVGTEDGAVSDSKLRAAPIVATAKSGRVLVVDDEAAVGRTIQRLLGDRHDVVVVTSGLQAIDLLEAGGDFDVVLCDMSMPDVTGMEVFTRSTASRPELAPRFVFMTGGSFHARTREFLENSSNTRIDKPFDLNVLRSIVRDRIAQQS